jgi:hypothetical protein
MNTFESHRDIIDAWPRLADFADDVRIPYGNAKAMRRRDRIGLEYVAAVVDAALARGIAGVTAELIARLAAEKAAATRHASETVSRFSNHEVAS